jgi:aspartate racemase
VRTIGLLGGMSWVSTTHYYELINADVARRLGTEHCAALTLWQGDFAVLTEMQRADQWHEAGEILAAGARSLVAAGADLVAICANTMHLCATQVAEAIAPVPLVDIVHVVRDECLAVGVTRLGLLGTNYTMESPRLYPPTLAAAGIEVVVPDPSQRAEIQRITFEELIAGVVTDRSRATFTEVATALVDRGAGAVALACTEHGMMLAEGDLAVPVLDTAVLHARGLVDLALA